MKGIVTKDKIMVLAGTNRAGSLSEIVANYYIELLKKGGAEASLLSLTGLPPDFTVGALYGNRGKDPVFNKLAEQVVEATKFVFIVPQYNGSFPGVLKAFIDGLPVGARDEGEVFRGKKSALVGVSKGYQGNILGISHLSDILGYLGVHVLPQKLYLGSIAHPSREALLAHEEYLQRLARQVEAFIKY